MTLNIAEFQNQGLVLTGARPSKFRVELFNLPFVSQNINRVSFAIQAASIPSFNVELVPVAYKGRYVNFAGDRNFQPWQIEVQNDEDFAVRAIFEKWQNAINTLISNAMDPNVYPTGYKCTAIVTQESQNGSDLRAYRLDGVFPIQIDAIQLNWGAQNQIETFGVTLNVDYVEPYNQSSSTDVYSPTITTDGSSGNISNQ